MKPTDDQILEHMANGPDLTYIIANRLKRSGFQIETPFVLRRMKFMAGSGRVKKVRNWVNPSSRMAMWQRVAGDRNAETTDA